ncbi:MAG: xanthine dehydrogenase small subunit, partial [Nitrospirales bacterium]
MVRFLQNQMVQEIDELDPNTSILDYLREHLRLCGTKDGCASGDCGACTVVIGELAQKEICYKAINACILPVATLQGKQLITVEDMRQGDALHPVQQAIVEQHASQCGFCTPGFVMSMFALQKNKSQPEREDIIDALGGNLCRCTGYRPLVDAALNMSHKGVDDQFSRYEQSTVASLEAINRSTDSVTLRGNGKQYFSPKNADELAQLLLQYPQARIMAGGTDLGLEITQELRDLEVIIYVGQVKELLIISESEGILEIGAAVSLTDCREALLGQYPNLRDLLERFGSLQIRNLATIGGNIANASPIGDMPPVLLGLGASLVLRCGEQRRTVLLEDFFVSYRVTALQPSEFIERILIPKARPGHEFRAYKISKRLSDDTSSTCGAFHLHIEKGIVGHASIAFSGLSETPRRAFHCEQALLHQPWNETTIESAMQALEQDFHPISDFRASSAYRMRVSKNLVKRLYLDIEGGDASLSLSQYPSQESHIVGRELNPVPLTGVIGLDLFHDSAGKHTSGEAVYTDDQLEHLNCLHAYVGLSQIARGQIRKLDLTAVRQAEGVREVLTLDDVPGHWDIGPVFPGDPVLAGREVEYWGQPIFAVAATSQRLARKAARLAQVEYEELEPCLSIKEALKQENFVRPPHVQDTGGVREAIANAPHCLTGELRIGGQDHFYLEGHVSLALPLEGNGMLVYT